MPVALVTMSHSPLLDYVDPPADVKEEVDAAFAAVCQFVSDFNPDVIVNFAPDHYNGFFYELMPPFCIGYAAESIGDYGSQAGLLDVPADLAKEMAEYVLSQGVGSAISLRMEVDHGAVQPMEVIYGDITAKPVIPVFINSVAPPFVPLRSIRELGRAIGEFSATATSGCSSSPPADSPTTLLFPASPPPHPISVKRSSAEAATSPPRRATPGSNASSTPRRRLYSARPRSWNSPPNGTRN